VTDFGRENVLVLGCKDHVGVMLDYGFERPYSPHHLCHLFPSLFPFSSFTSDQIPKMDEIPPFDPTMDFKAIFMVTDPIDWMVESQVWKIIDLVSKIN